MSNDVKTKGSLKPQGPAQTVGQNIKERSEYLRLHNAQVRKQHVPVGTDQFLKAQKKSATTKAFNPNAEYKAGRRLWIGVKKPMIDHLENGTAQQATQGPPPISDAARLKFLDWIVANPKVHNARSIRQHAMEDARKKSNNKPGANRAPYSQGQPARPFAPRTKPTRNS